MKRVCASTVHVLVVVAESFGGNPEEYFEQLKCTSKGIAVTSEIQ